jgi:hypothetical protein
LARRARSSPTPQATRGSAHEAGRERREASSGKNTTQSGGVSRRRHYCC